MTQTDPGAGTTQTNETTSFTNTALSTGVGSATASVKGQVTTVTDLLNAVMVTSAEEHFSGVLARSVAEKIEVDCAANYANFSNTTGTSGSDLTLAQFIAAVSALEGRDVAGNLVGTFHTQQILDLRSGSGNTAGGILPGFAASQTGMEFLANPQFDGSILTNVQPKAGNVGPLFGVQVYQTSAVATANTGADRAGAIWEAGEALGFYEVWSPRTEMHRDAFMPATQIAVTSCYGTCEIDDLRGQTVTTDA